MSQREVISRSRARGVDDAGDLVLDHGLGVQLIEHGAAFGLGGVGGEDELDVELVEDGLHRVRRTPLALSSRSAAQMDSRMGGVPGTEYWAPPAPAQQPHAVGLLGEVDQLEIDGEGHGHARGLGGREPLDRGAELPGRVGVAAAAAFGQQAQVFLEVEGFPCPSSLTMVSPRMWPSRRISAARLSDVISGGTLDMARWEGGRIERVDGRIRL